MKIFRRHFFVLVVLPCLLVSACSNNPEKEVTDAVRMYNEKLVTAFAKPNPNLLVDVATAKQQDRISLYVVNIMQKGQILMSTLDRIQFGRVTFEGADKAKVDAKEEWTYEYVDPIERKPLEPKKKMRYEITYTLQLIKGDWMVDELKIHKEE